MVSRCRTVPVGDAVVERELRRMNEHGLLHAGELLVEIESASMGRSPGALVVTDRRVLFVSTSLVRRRTTVVAITLTDVESVSDPVPGWGWGMKNGAEVLIQQADAPEPMTVERIQGGTERASEIVESILRERERSRKRSSLM